MKTGIFIFAPLQSPARERVAELQRRFDPKLAALHPPHVTLAGSSGMGPIDPATSVDELRAALEPIARATAPLTLRFEPVHRYMGKDVVVLPLNPHGPLRTLHEAIKGSGLRYERPFYAFSPHATISFFREIPRERMRDLMSVRVDEPVVLDRIECWLTKDFTDTRRLLELPLGS